MKKLGFSLVELMIVVAIIGILATLAVPKFQGFQARARQSEAKSNLTQIYTLQMAYHGENDTYVSLPATGRVDATTTNCPANALGFVPSPCEKVRYQYSDSSAPSTSSFATLANSIGTWGLIWPGCTGTALNDTWQVDENKSITNLENYIAGCQ